MRLGMIGLGRIGANMVRRLMRSGHTCSGLSQVDCRIHRPPPHGLRIGFSSNGVWRGRFVDEHAWIYSLDMPRTCLPGHLDSCCMSARVALECESSRSNGGARR